LVRGAFTLVELLVVIAIIAVLAALLVPVLAPAKARGQEVGCLNNLKQLALAAAMYPADNGGKLALNVPTVQVSGSSAIGTNAWVVGNLKLTTDSTNETFIRQGLFFPYVGHLAVYRCPADASRTGSFVRARSYAMNGWMGSRYMETSLSLSAFRTFVKESQLAPTGAAGLWSLGDEHEESIDDGWFLVTMNDYQPFASFPATRHHRGYGVNFADGHVAMIRLRDPSTQSPARQINYQNADWIRLKQMTTVGWGK
jgi:prepilin-type N-terminal cleavage/methylation domain-containing protein